MILGRPVQLWLAATGALWGLLVIVAHLDPTIAGAGGLAISAIVGLVANQPPTLAPGDTYNIATPAGQPNYEATVAPPPAPTKPVVTDEP